MGRTPSGSPVVIQHSSPSSASDHDGQKWHRIHCSDTDLCQAMCIRDAFGFTDNNKKEVSKKERVWSLGDGVRRDYGTCRVSRLYPARINCDLCATFIVDRAGEALFFFCWRCRRAGRSFQLCVDCHEGGAFGSAGTRVNSLTRRSPRSTGVFTSAGQQSSTSLESGVDPALFGRVPSLRRSPCNTVTSLGTPAAAPTSSQSPAVSRSPSLGSMQQLQLTSSHGLQLKGTIPSGTWKGEIKEGRSRRTAKRELTFLSDGRLTGTGDEGCTLKGSFTNGPSHFRVNWVELYEWGQFKVSAQLSVSERAGAQLEGEFVASDGGSGLVVLRYP
uniref:Uncharacterized protein n=1 Tax=Alexandrium catenella TaxID=2925 RepID=A0A7S1WWG5_ALECA